MILMSGGLVQGSCAAAPMSLTTSTPTATTDTDHKASACMAYRCRICASQLTLLRVCRELDGQSPLWVRGGRYMTWVSNGVY